MRTGIGQFTVGAHIYKYEELSPMDALRFGTQCAKILGPALTALTSVAGIGNNIGSIVEQLSPALANIDDEKMEGLLLTAFARVYTPENGSLGDESIFNSWFKENKSELFPVGITALYHLSKDFFPKLPDMPQTDSPTQATSSI